MTHQYHTIIAQPGTMLEIVNENGEYLCSLLGNKTDEEKQADAAFILAACNSHNELLEALQDVTASLAMFLFQEGGIDALRQSRTLNTATTAIEKARINVAPK